MNNKLICSSRKCNRLLLAAAIVLLLLCFLFTAALGLLYVKHATPQRLLARLGFSFPNETDQILASWNTSLSQLDYDSDIVFIGDSLTLGENFQQYFPDKKIVNLGVYGDTLAEISKRAYIISHLNPEMIFIEGGINSLQFSNADTLATTYESMLVEIMTDNPGARVFIQSIFPISNKRQLGGRTNENIVILNTRLQDIAEEHGATYIDLHSVYVLNGEMNPEYTKDGVHLKNEYKYLWLDVLADHLH